jgi:hypothetical protein
MLQAIGGGFGTHWFPYLLVARLFSAVWLPGLWSLFFFFLSLSWVFSFYKSLAGFHNLVWV